MIKTGLIILTATGVLGTSAVQADLLPPQADITTEITAGLVKVEFGGPDGFDASFTKAMVFNLRFISGSGKTVTISL